MARFQTLFVVGCVLLALCCGAASAATISPDLSDLGLWAYSAHSNGAQTHSTPSLVRASSGDATVATLTLNWEGGLGSGISTFSWFTGAYFAISPQESSDVIFAYEYQVAKQPTWAALDRIEVDPGVAVQVGSCLCWYQHTGDSFSDELFTPRSGSVPLSDLMTVDTLTAIRGDNGTCDQVVYISPPPLHVCVVGLLWVWGVYSSCARSLFVCVLSLFFLYFLSLVPPASLTRFAVVVVVCVLLCVCVCCAPLSSCTFLFCLFCCPCVLVSLGLRAFPW
jgi:hypothetical protein